VSRQTVLVVEDDPQVRGLLVKLLAPEDVDVVPLESGEAAISRLDAEEPVDLLLLDVGLPGLGGFDVCRKIKGHRKTRLIPVIIVTGRGAVQDRVQGIDAGADDFLVKPVERVELLARVRSLLRLKSYTDELEHAESVLFALARSIEARDPATKGHCERLSNLGASLGRYLDLDEEDILALWKAGVVHDLGKIKVPDAILLKPGPLTSEERAVIEEHPVTGDEICKPIRSFRRVRPIIRHHHERMDGSGYPDRLRGDEIPVTARVLHVVDVFDALITTRPYKPAFPLERALSTLQDEARRGWQDGEIVSSFCDLVASSGGGGGKRNGSLVGDKSTIQSDEAIGFTLH